MLLFELDKVLCEVEKLLCEVGKVLCEVDKVVHTCYGQDIVQGGYGIG